MVGSLSLFSVNVVLVFTVKGWVFIGGVEIAACIAMIRTLHPVMSILQHIFELQTNSCANQLTEKALLFCGFF